MIDIGDIGALGNRLGQQVAVGDWVEVAQARINQFAEATGDRQWIHVDQIRAAAESPFGTTIAHGFLTLSLVSALIRHAMTFSGVRLAINYGVNRVRFMSPVPAGSRIRGGFTPIAIEALDDCHQVTWRVVVERDGAEKPCCVAEWLVRYYPSE